MPVVSKAVTMPFAGFVRFANYFIVKLMLVELILYLIRSIIQYAHFRVLETTLYALLLQQSYYSISDFLLL